MEFEEELAKILGPMKRKMEEMLGDGRGGASSTMSYHIKNAKPIKTTLIAPSETKFMMPRVFRDVDYIGGEPYVGIKLMSITS